MNTDSGTERPSGEPSRVLIVDDNPDVRAAIRLLLAQHPDFRVVSECQQFDEVLQAASEAQPDVILLDWELCGLVPDDGLAQLRACCPAAAILALSTRDEQCQEALGAGASAFVSKGEPPSHLLAALSALVSS